MRLLSLTVAAALTLAVSSGPSQARYPYYGYNYYNPCAAAYVYTPAPVYRYCWEEALYDAWGRFVGQQRICR